jgi:hypothetical protein
MSHRELLGRAFSWQKRKSALLQTQWMGSGLSDAAFLRANASG